MIADIDHLDGLGHLLELPEHVAGVVGREPGDLLAPGVGDVVVEAGHAAAFGLSQRVRFDGGWIVSGMYERRMHLDRAPFTGFSQQAEIDELTRSYVLAQLYQGLGMAAEAQAAHAFFAERQNYFGRTALHVTSTPRPGRRSGA